MSTECIAGNFTAIINCRKKPVVYDINMATSEARRRKRRGFSFSGMLRGEERVGQDAACLHLDKMREADLARQSRMSAMRMFIKGCVRQ